MATITDFNPVENAPGTSKPGLKRAHGSTSEVIVIGDGLDDTMTLWVKYTRGFGPRWQGPLKKNLVQGDWTVVLTCATSTSAEEDVGGREGEGGPEDVPVTVTAGTDVAAPVATKDTTVTVG